MFFKVLALALVGFLVYIVYIKTVHQKVEINQTENVESYSQFDLFRDMEPVSQVRENVWVGFLQEDLTKNRTGPIGDFVGYDDPSPNAPLYKLQ
jgi:hypothetical protein